jgi:nucleoside 2-deoxyribosyltransferase
VRIYLAAPYAARDHLRRLIHGLSMSFTSEWLLAEHAIHDGVVDAAPGHPDEYVRMQAEGDLADIVCSDALILFSSHFAQAQWGLRPDQTTSGGRHIETGYALAKGKPVVVVGQPENIFHRGACKIVPTFGLALEYLDQLNKENHASQHA